MLRVGLAAVAACAMAAGCGGGGAQQSSSAPASHQPSKPAAPAFPPAPTGKALTMKVAEFPESFQIVGVEEGPSLMGASVPADPGTTQLGILLSVRPLTNDRTSPVSVSGSPFGGIFQRNPPKECPGSHGEEGCFIDVKSSPVYPEQQVRAPGGRNLLHLADEGSSEGAERLQPGVRYYVELYVSDLPEPVQLSTMDLCEDPTEDFHCLKLGAAPKLPRR